MKRIIAFLFCSILTVGVSLNAANLYLVGNNSSAWTTSVVTGYTVCVVDLSNSGTNGTTAVSLTQWLNDRNAPTPTYLIGGNAGTSFVTSDQVWIAKGTYNVAIAWTVLTGTGSAVPAYIYGGFAGNETSVLDRIKGTNVWDFTNETIVNSNTSTTGVITAGGDRNNTLDGITFTGGVTIAAIATRGGMFVQNCKFTANTAGALSYYTTTASKNASCTNCYFYNNSISGSLNAASIYVNNGSSGGTYSISNCFFESNSCSSTASGASAGIKSQGTGTTNITSSIFKNNSATAGNSSAVSLTSLTSYLTNCLIYGASLGSKPALYLTIGNVTNCTLVNNLGGAAYMNQIAAAGNIKIINTVFWGADGSTTAGSGFIGTIANCLGTITNCAYNGLAANFISTPTGTVTLTTASTGVFTDPTNNIWTLMTGSPLIDTGTSTGSPANDLIGTSRAKGAGFDIGAYEFIPDLGTGVNTTSKNDFSCFASAQSVQLRGININDEVIVFSVSGLKIKSVITNSALVSIPLSKGIYLIKVADIVKKVVVN